MAAVHLPSAQSQSPEEMEDPLPQRTEIHSGGLPYRPGSPLLHAKYSLVIPVFQQRSTHSFQLLWLLQPLPSRLSHLTHTHPESHYPNSQLPDCTDSLGTSPPLSHTRVGSPHVPHPPSAQLEYCPRLPFSHASLGPILGCSPCITIKLALMKDLGVDSLFLLPENISGSVSGWKQN